MKKNPNCSNKQLKQVARQFRADDWGWLCTQGRFLDAVETLTAQEISDLADVMLSFDEATKVISTVKPS